MLQIVEAMPHSDSVETFLEKLGSFYEMVDTNAVNGRARRCNNNDVAMNMKALTEKPSSEGEGETKHAVSPGITSTTQNVDVESTSKHTDMDASIGEGCTGLLHKIETKLFIIMYTSK